MCETKLICPSGTRLARRGANRPGRARRRRFRRMRRRGSECAGTLFRLVIYLPGLSREVSMGADEVLRGMLMYFVLPLWLAAGFADYLCHRATHIEKTSGWKESVLHLAQFAEMGVPVLAALFLEITSGVILLMMVFLVLHEATTIWDVRYASALREISPTEQHVHSVLEMLPLTGLLLVIALYWPAFAALLGYGTPDFSFTLKQQPLPLSYIITMLTLTALFEVLPFLEELIRGLRYRERPARD
jgi:hypothetical protein